MAQGGRIAPALPDRCGDRGIVADAIAGLPVEICVYTRSCRRLDERILRRLLGSHPSASRLVYEHVDSTSESLLWIADIAAWCYGAGRDWRERIDPIVNTVIDLG